MRLVVSKLINNIRLGKELNAAGIVNEGISLFGNILEIKLIDENQANLVIPIIDAHNGTDTVGIRQSNARAIAQAIPNWAKWSQQDWATWRDANVSTTQINAVASLADAKVILNKMSVVLDSLAKMEIAIRDQVWPDIPEG